MSDSKFQVLITGSTGMVGKGVLLECLESPVIQKIIVLNRNPIGIIHPKLEEVLLKDFSKIDTVSFSEKKIDACFHCMGVSSLGKSEEEFNELTYEVTKKLADVYFDLNPEMTFIYVSGTGTDSSESGRVMWARVKGKTENYLLNKGFGRAVMFRPGMILPEKGIRSRTNWYQYVYVILSPFFPLFRLSKHVTTTTKIGQAMIKCLEASPAKAHLENPDINQWVNS